MSGLNALVHVSFVCYIASVFRSAFFLSYILCIKEQYFENMYCKYICKVSIKFNRKCIDLQVFKCSFNFVLG